MKKPIDKRKILALICVPIVLIIIFILFITLFKFDKNDNTPLDKIDYPKIDQKLLEELRNEIPEYNYYYSNYNNISTSVILKKVHDYIEIYNNDQIIKITDQEFSEKTKIMVDEKIKVLYKIELKTYDDIGKKIYGPNTVLKHMDFSFSNKNAKYIKDDGYYFYETNEETEKKYITESNYIKYEITDGGATLIIHDNYIMCSIENGDCYNDVNKHEINKSIKLIDGVIKDNGNTYQKYIHTFKFANGHYYWNNTEPEKKR